MGGATQMTKTERCLIKSVGVSAMAHERKVQHCIGTSERATRAASVAVMSVCATRFDVPKKAGYPSVIKAPTMSTNHRIGDTVLAGRSPTYGD